MALIFEDYFNLELAPISNDEMFLPFQSHGYKITLYT